jgi:hypothetical protein
MTIAIPKPLKEEHDELHEERALATKEPGAVGEAAKQIARLLHPHFISEEEYALPPPGLLAALAQGETPGSAHPRRCVLTPFPRRWMSTRLPNSSRNHAR